MKIKNTLKLATLIGLVGLGALTPALADNDKEKDKPKHTTKALHDFMMSRVSNKKTYNRAIDSMCWIGAHRALCVYPHKL